MSTGPAGRGAEGALARFGAGAGPVPARRAPADPPPAAAPTPARGADGGGWPVRAARPGRPRPAPLPPAGPGPDMAAAPPGAGTAPPEPSAAPPAEASPAPPAPERPAPYAGRALSGAALPPARTAAAPSPAPPRPGPARRGPPPPPAPRAVPATAPDGSATAPGPAGTPDRGPEHDAPRGAAAEKAGRGPPAGAAAQDDAAPPPPLPRPAELAAALRRAPGFARVVGMVVGLSFARQALLLATPLLTMHVFDSMVEARNLDTLTVLAVLFVLAILMGNAMRALRASLMAALAEDLAKRLSLEALQAAVRSALAGSRRPGLAALQDTSELRRFLGGGSVADAFDVVAVPVALLVLALLHPVYAVITGAVCAGLVVLGVVLDRTTRRLVRHASDRQLQTQGELQGRLRQPDLLEGLGMLGAVVRRWQPAQGEALLAADRAQARARALRGVAELASYLAQALVVVAGVALAIGDRVSPGSIVAAMLLAGTATNPISRIVLAWREWAYAALAWRRLTELFRAHAPPAAAPPDADGPPGLWLRGLDWTPPGAARPVLAGLTLYCPPRTLTLLTGPNGTGKSSLLRLAVGLLPPDAGRVTLDGQDPHAADRDALGERIGYLPQEVQLLEGSVLDNIARFRADATGAATEAARRAGAHGMIGRLPLGYATEAGPSGGLSMGQRRMVGLARALCGPGGAAPALLVLDEPEAGLDAPSREAMKAAVLAAREAGTACLVVSHDPGLWRGQVDQVLALAPGGGFAATVPEDAPIRLRGEM